MLTFPLRVAGKTVAGIGTVIVRAPWTGEPVGLVHLGGEADADAAAGHAATLFAATRKTAAFERKRWLRDIAEGVRSEATMLAALIAEEAGKPITLARAEVERGIATLELGAEEATRFHGELLHLDVSAATATAQGLVERVPLGPVFALSPFNFPLNLVCHKLAPALALGVPVVLKPAPQAPLTALALAAIVEEAGLPRGMFQVLPCAIPVAEALARDERLPVLSFTGSARVGFHLRALVPHKRVILELGGNAAAIVLADADLAWAAPCVVAGAFAYAGQVCIKTQRVYVEDAVYEPFVADLVRRTRALAPLDPHDERAELSCLIDVANAERVDKWIDEAKESGARVLLGGPRKGKVVPPTLLEIDGEGEGLRVVDEEVFGPVLTIHRVGSRADAFRAANRGKYGLQAALFTRDTAAVDEAFEALSVGALIVNDRTTFRVDGMPYGGTRASGSGREGVRYAMEDLTDRKLLVRRR